MKLLPEGIKVVADALREAGGASLLVDGNAKGVPSLVDLEIEPEELWSLPSSAELKVAVVSKPRNAKELYRILSMLDSLVAVNGKILILPYEDPSLPTECRFEATEAFIGVYSWGRCLRPGNIVQLTKVVKVEASASEHTDAIMKAAKLLPALSPISPRYANVSTAKSSTSTKSGKRVISLAIFGDSHYAHSLGAYVRAHHALFPGYELRIHHDEILYHSNYGGSLHGLQARGLVKLVYMGSDAIAHGKCKAMLWRLAPAWDPEVEYVFARDVDALPTWRERCVVEEEIISAVENDIESWTIGDAQAHAGVMGGLCGFKASKLREMFPTFEDFVNAAGFTDEQWAEHGADQNYLNSKICTKLRVFEHALCTFDDENGKPYYRSRATVEHAVRFSTTIATPSQEVRDSISKIVREHSDVLIPYMGVAGHDHVKAVEFYNNYGPPDIIKQITEAETEANELPTGLYGGHESNKFAIFSSDTNSNYAFYLPLTTVMWRIKNFRPLIILVGKPEEWLSSNRLAVENARRFGAQIHFLGDYEGFNTGTVAQLSRIYAANVPGIKDDDYLLTSDIDMWNLGSWVGKEEGIDNVVQLYNSNAYKTDSSTHTQYPMCYVGAFAKTWREIVGKEPIRECLSRGLKAFDEAKATWSAEEVKDRAWFFDERYLGSLLDVWCEKGGLLHEIPRKMYEGGQFRLDRSAWKIPSSLDSYADAHLVRPGFGSNWAKIRPILALSLSDGALKWADDYHYSWLNAIGENG